MLILYFSWDGLRGKRLGFWVYLEVKTVGTAVPGTVMSSVQDVQAADLDTAAGVIEVIRSYVEAQITAFLNTGNTLVVSSEESSVIQSEARAKAQELLNAALADPALQAEGVTAELLQNYIFDWDDSVVSTADKTWTPHLTMTNSSTGDMSTITLPVIKYSVENAVDVDEIFDAMNLGAVTYLVDGTTTSSDVGALTQGEYDIGFQKDATTNENNLTKLIKGADERIAAVTTALGEIAVENNTKVWRGEVTLELATGETGSRTISVALNFVDAVASYDDISVTDNRSEDDKLINIADSVDGSSTGTRFDFTNVSVTLTDNEGDTETLTGTDAIYDAIDTGKIVLDTGSYSKGKLGKYNVYLRLSADNSKFVTIPVQVVGYGTVNPVELNFSSKAVIQKIVSSDTSILAATTDDQYIVYQAGTTSVDVTDNSGNTVTAQATVAEDGVVTFTTDFEAVINDQIIGEGFADLAKNQGAEISVKDPIVTARYVQDADGTEHVYLTPVAVGKTQLTVTFGTQGKLRYTYNVTVSDKGIITVEVAENLAIGSISLPAATQKALTDADYYSTVVPNAGTNYAASLDGDTAVNRVVVKGIVGGSVENMDELLVTITSSTGVDTITLDTSNMWFTNSYYVDKSNSTYATRLHIGFGDEEETLAVTLKQKIDITFDDLKLTPARAEYDDQYVEVIDNGNNSFSIVPKMTADEERAFTVNFYDGNGGVSTVTGVVKGYTITQQNIQTPGVNADTVEYTQPTTQEYTIGDAVDVSGASFSYIPTGGGNRLDVNVTSEMFFDDVDGDGAYTAGTDVKLSTAAAGLYDHVYFMYGDYVSTEFFSVTVNPAEIRMTTEDLGLSPQDTISFAEMVSGDNEISVGITSDGYVYFQSTAIDKEAVARVTTKNGNTAFVYIDVDTEGNITAVSDVNFKTTVQTLDEEALGLYPETVSVDDTDCVSAAVQAGKVVLKSLAPGDATVTVTDADGAVATISVTVYADGSMSVDVTKPITEGWVKGEGSDWYYLKDGERVVSDWVCVQEEDPYNNNEVGDVWYHFGSDGKMQRGWIVDETGWKVYLLDSNGRMMHSQWVNAPAQESLNRPAGLYKLTDDGAVQMNGWAKSVDNENIEWFCNAGNGLFEVDNPASWRVVG